MTLDDVLAQGFDRSTLDDETGYTNLRCSQCAAVSINGVPCHENGCPNIVHARDDFYEVDDEYDADDDLDFP